MTGARGVAQACSHVSDPWNEGLGGVLLLASLGRLVVRRPLSSPLAVCFWKPLSKDQTTILCVPDLKGTQ